MKLKLFLTVAALVAFGALVYFARQDIFDTFRRLNEVNLWALAAIIPLQLLSYHAITRLYIDYFEALGDKLSYPAVFSTALELNFVNQVFPSGGVSGVSYLSYRLKHYGVAYAKSTLAQIARFGLTFVSYQILLFAGLIVLIYRGKASGITIAITLVIAVLILGGTFLAIYIIQDRQRIGRLTAWIARVLNQIFRAFRIKREVFKEASVKKLFGELHDDYQILSSRWRNLVGPGGWSLIANMAEIATIYAVYIAFGEWVNIGAVIIAYAVANFAGAIAVLPGGIGVYESLMTIVMVSAGVPAGLSLSVTVMYRVINMMTFLPIGYILYHRAVRKFG
jgi:uncharacterized protein (TIRG00374 family)